jgi:hypothetical protein
MSEAETRIRMDVHDAGGPKLTEWLDCAYTIVGTCTDIQVTRLCRMENGSIIVWSMEYRIMNAVSSTPYTDIIILKILQCRHPWLGSDWRWIILLELSISCPL